MAPLAVLPVFFKLEDKKAVVAGGSAAAAWKAELLAAAGAEVHVYAEALDPAFATLIAAGPPAGAFLHHPCAWDARVFAGAAIAVADAATDAEAAAFFNAARAAGVPVNVIDRPAWCGFRFGAIVNRSPAVVAISTDGAAPILGQAIRRRIETLLPPALAGWAALARDLRGTVMARLAAGPQRRAFFERLVDRAFGPAPDADAAEALIAEAKSIAAGVDASRGRVTLVGAGSRWPRPENTSCG
jgi:uroporphyrin-III C-methyltransferase/precorrin-2 dehydrogenase/sirohydrochlorin ferrochelatase